MTIAGSPRRKSQRPTTCAVKETVAGLDGIVDSVGAGVIVHFPKPGLKINTRCDNRDGYAPKANKGHLVTAVELDGRGRHDGV